MGNLNTNVNKEILDQNNSDVTANDQNLVSELISFISEKEEQKRLEEEKKKNNFTKEYLLNCFDEALEKCLKNIENFVRFEIKISSAKDCYNFKQNAEDLGFEATFTSGITKEDFYIITLSSDKSIEVKRRLDSFNEKLKDKKDTTEICVKNICNTVKLKLHNKDFLHSISEENEEKKVAKLTVKYPALKTKFENSVAKSFFNSLNLNFKGFEGNDNWVFDIPIPKDCLKN